MYFRINIVVVVLIAIPLHILGQNATKGFQLLKQQKHSDAVETFNKAISIIY